VELLEMLQSNAEYVRNYKTVSLDIAEIKFLDVWHEVQNLEAFKRDLLDSDPEFLDIFADPIQNSLQLVALESLVLVVIHKSNVKCLDLPLAVDDAVVFIKILKLSASYFHLVSSQTAADLIESLADEADEELVRNISEDLLKNLNGEIQDVFLK
jgi:hypothetical protein